MDPQEFRASSPTTKALILVGIAIGITIFAHILKFIYNIYFHPLSSYPGPKLWAGSRLFLFKHELSGNLVFQVKQFHDKYGPVVRIAPTELSYTTPTALKTIYGHRSVEMPKALDGRGGLPPPPSGAHSIITADRTNHSRMRRNVSHAFSEQALRHQESLIQDHITHLIDKLNDKAKEGEAQDICKWYNLAAFDIVSHLSFGESFDCLGQEDFHPWVLSVLGAIKSLPWTHIVKYYQIGDWAQRVIFPHVKEARRYNYKFAAERMERRLAVTEERNDFTSYMLRHRDDNEKGLSLTEMKVMGTALTNAGSETTASLLGSEIRDAFTSEGQITMPAVSELKYLTAVLDEALRLFPPVPSVLPRVVPGEGDTIDDKWVPGDTAVGVPHYATFRSEANFHQPNNFAPERWLPQDRGGSPEFKNDNKAVFQPFSFGPRNCIGKNLAYADMRLILARLLFNFDLDLDASSTNWLQARIAPFLWERVPLMVKLTPRCAAI